MKISQLFKKTGLFLPSLLLLVISCGKQNPDTQIFGASEPINNSFFIVSKVMVPKGASNQYLCLTESLSANASGRTVPQFIWKKCDPRDRGSMQRLAEEQVGAGKYWSIKQATKKKQCYLDKIDCEISGRFTLSKPYSATELDLLSLTQSVSTPIRIESSQIFLAATRYYSQYRSGDFMERYGILLFLDTNAQKRVCLSRAFNPSAPQVEVEIIDKKTITLHGSSLEENTLEYCRQIFLLPSNYYSFTPGSFIDLEKVL